MTDTAVIFDIIGRDRTSAAIAASGSAFNKFALGLAAGAAFAGAKFVDMAGNFQQGMTRLKTGAGEVDSNMHMVSEGILKMAGQVGESTQDLLKGMYLIESAGFHGAQGLDVLRIAAMGAKVGNADMATVADAVTTALNAYHVGADGAAAATNALIAAEGQGKTNLEALSSSLSTVAPIASLAHVSLNELLGAMATMTGQGTDAASAATYLKQTIGQLSNPTAKARSEMEALGLDATKVSMNLGKNGLASTLQMLTDAIEKKMGPAGTVLIQKLQQASGNATKFQQILANLPPTQQTFIGALATMTGGTKSMQAALELTGDNMKVFQHNTDVINEKVKAGGSNIEGWADVQKNFNQKMAEAKGTIEALAIKIGSALMPKVLMLLDGTMSVVQWFTKHKDVASALAITFGILGAAFVAYRVGVVLYEAGAKAVMVATKAWAAAQWVLNVAMDANPVGAIILAVVAIAAGVYLLWTHSKGFRDFFIGMWGYIWGFLKTVGSWFAGPFAHFFVEAWHMISAPFLWLWQNVLYPGWQAIVMIIKVVMQIVTSFINLWLYLSNQVIQPVWQNIIKPAFMGMAAVAIWLWQNAIYPAGQAIGLVFHGIAEVLMWLWHTIFEPVWAGAKFIFESAAHFIDDKFSMVMDKVDKVGRKFREVFDAIGGFVSGAFHGAVGVVKDSINAIIGLLNSAINFINNNMIDVANHVPGVNFPHIPHIPYLAQGGTIAQAGSVVVGDRGPEILTLPTGATVTPLGRSATGGGGGRATLRFAGNMDSALATLIQALIRGGLLQMDVDGVPVTVT